MRAVLVKTEGDSLEAVIIVNNREFHVMDDFGGKNIESGVPIEIAMSAGLLDESESWDSIFSGNHQREKSLTHISGWCYRARGQVVKIGSETLVDVELQTFQAPFFTNDDAILGEYVSFTINRLDASNS